MLIACRLGDGILIEPKNQKKILQNDEEGEYDLNVYPEKYRKTNRDFIIHQPFDIGIIEKIISKSRSKYIQIRRLYRPNQISVLEENDALNKDYNLLYWTDDFIDVDIKKIQGKCYIQSELYLNEQGMNLNQWTDEGENRFYFNEKFDLKTKKISGLSYEARTYRPKCKNQSFGSPPVVEQPLQCLDIFVSKNFA